MIRPYAVRRERALPWREPLEVLQAIGARDGTLGLFSGTGGRVLIGTDPDAVCQTDCDAAEAWALLDDPAWGEGAVQLLAYDGGARPATGPR